MTSSKVSNLSDYFLTNADFFHIRILKNYLYIPHDKHLTNKAEIQCQLVRFRLFNFLRVHFKTRHITVFLSFSLALSPHLSHLVYLFPPCYFLTPAPQKLPLSDSSLGAPTCQRSDRKHTHITAPLKTQHALPEIDHEMQKKMEG